ncbi:MAG: tetratricopeptide repeat protein [Planctomicrobium sp.]|jgi:hypothetical protein|nr:tetratricopeptide repeat protein [Planctomicrobium sp.]
MISQLAQMTDSYEPVDSTIPAEEFAYELSYWQWFWWMSSGWMGTFYFVFLIWMLIYCLRHDPERYLWMWVIIVLWPFGPFIYFIARWLPSSQIRMPAFTHRWTKQREIRQLETAAIQIGNSHQHAQYGDALKSVGKHEEALAAYEKALNKEPTSLPALWGAATMEFKLEKYDSAKVHLEQVLAIEEGYKFGDVSLLYGKTLRELGLKDEARLHLEKHTKKWRQPEAMYVLANLYVNNEQPDQAKIALQNLIIDLDSSPKAIARKHVFWKSRAKRLLRKLS